MYSQTKEIGVGIIGFGLATKVFHAPFVSAVPGLELRSILERTGTAAAQAYPDARTVRSVADLLQDSALDLIVVATPNDTHFPLARQALEAGKHVVIDKPFAATSVEARTLIELAGQAGLTLAPFHNRRWDGDFLTVRKLVADGTLGRIATFETHFDRFRPIPREHPWKESASAANGMLFDLGPHLVDQALALFGMPEAITASVRTDRDASAIEDAFDITLHYPAHAGRGLLARCRSTYLACDNSSRFLLHGTRGSFRKEGLDPQEPALVAGAKVPRMGSPEVWLQEEESLWGTLTLAPDPADPNTLTRTRLRTIPGDYRGFYANVRDAITGAAPLAVSPKDGYRVVRLLELARESSSARRTLPIQF